MLSQHLTIDILNHAGGDLYARTGEGESRAVLFGITSGGDRDWNTVYVNINNPVVTARIVKPDGTFTITTAELISGPGELQEFRFYIPEAATQVSGIGSYDIRVQEDGEENIVYSAQGRFICDDNMLTDEMIESVAAVDGLIFPDDFATTENMEEIVEEVARELGFAEIDDNSTSTGKTWSSDKISGEIANKTEINDNVTSTASTWSGDKIADEIADSVAGVIDDNSTTTGTTWSSDKIAGEIADKTEINDNTTSTTSTWSSDKIADEIARAGGSVIYSTTEHIIGTWIDGKSIYEITFSTTTPSLANESTVIINLSGYNIDTLIDMDGIITAPLLGQKIPVKWSYNSSLLGTLYVDNSNLKQVIPPGYTSCAEHITIRYTKTA